MPSLWSNEIAVVTGATGSIGAAIVDRLLTLGARVAGADRYAESFIGERRRMDRVDVTDSAAVDTWIAAASQAWGTPTICIACAGISRPGRLVDLSDADWRDVLAVNLDAAFYTARAAIRAMLAARVRGRIVFVGSWAAHAPHPHIGAYTASKAGLRALCRTLALDHAQDGILINEVAPGIVDAGLSRELFRVDPALKARTLAGIPTGLLARAEDVARDVAFLVSPENRHTTGTTLVSDGAISLASIMNPGSRQAVEGPSG